MSISMSYLYGYKTDMSLSMSKELKADVFSTTLDGYYSHFTNIKPLDTHLQQIAAEQLPRVQR